MIEIAFQEGVNPRKGFELILEHHGICSATTWFGSIRECRSRAERLRILVGSLYRETAALKRAIASAENAEPQTDRVVDGHQLMRWIAVHHPHTRSVLMSGCDMKCENCAYSPRCLLIAKPFQAVGNR